LVNLKKYPNLYTEKDLEECLVELRLFELESKVSDFISDILLTRKIKHSLKIILAFVPEFIEMFYIIIIKRKHLK
jgi:hypothetical protein